MSNLILDSDDFYHLQNLPVNRSHMVNHLVIHAQEAIVAGDKLIVSHTENGRMIEDETVSTLAELNDFVARHFPAYVEELKAAVDAIRGASEGLN